tara:strand:- start:356 stop:607 length:252 start_codon:yes stop_codon:yes gene_type:complete
VEDTLELLLKMVVQVVEVHLILVRGQETLPQQVLLKEIMVVLEIHHHLKNQVVAVVEQLLLVLMHLALVELVELAVLVHQIQF